MVVGLELAAAGSGLVGFPTYTVLTGSMAPALPVGSLVLDETEAAAAVRPGQVITFPMPADPSDYVTHRVERVGAGPEGDYLVTRGDANSVSDAWRVPAAGQVGRVILDLPLAGYLATLPGRVVLVLAFAVLLLRPPPRLEGRRSPALPLPDTPLPSLGPFPDRGAALSKPGLLKPLGSSCRPPQSRYP